MNKQREIKFRAWFTCPKCSDMIAHDSCIGIGISPSGKLEGAHNIYCGYCGKYYRGEPKAIIEQYTGLKDANGVEIYEGDNLTDAVVACWTVYWLDGAFMINPNVEGWAHRPLCRLGAEFMTVIGNIHDNAELLAPCD